MHLRVRLTTHRKSVRKFNLRLLLSTCVTVWSGLYIKGHYAIFVAAGKNKVFRFFFLFVCLFLFVLFFFCLNFKTFPKIFPIVQSILRYNIIVVCIKLSMGF